MGGTTARPLIKKITSGKKLDKIMEKRNKKWRGGVREICLHYYNCRGLVGENEWLNWKMLYRR